MRESSDLHCVVSEAPPASLCLSLLGFCPPPASRVKSTLSNEDVKAGLVWTPYLSFRELHTPLKRQLLFPRRALCSQPPGLAHLGLHWEGLSHPCGWAERTITPTPQSSLPLPNWKAFFLPGVCLLCGLHHTAVPSPSSRAVSVFLLLASPM